MRPPLRSVRWPSWLLVAVLALAAGIIVVRGLAPGSVPEPSVAGAPVAEAARAPQSDIGFRSAQRLREHFEKHGAEFRAPDAAAYLAIAQALRDAPAGGPVLEAVRADRVVTRFDRRDGTFIAFDGDGTIRTCFRPNDGERYFKRQAAR